MSNWPQRSTAPGVTMATDFSTDAQVDPFKAYPTDPEALRRVTRHVDNGVPCLRINTPANAADSNHQGWHRRMNDSWTKDKDGFGTTPFWIQFRFKIPPSRLIKWASYAGGWKFAIIANSFHEGAKKHQWASSNNISHVLADTYYRGFPILYRHDNQHTNGHNFEGKVPGVLDPNEVNLSPGWDRGPQELSYLHRYCCYSDKPGVRSPLGYGGCPRWVSDEWITFMVRIHTRTFGGTAGNELDFMWALPGDTAWTTLLRQRDYLMGQDGNWPNGFNDIGFTTYETGRNGPGVDTYALYRELIVSTQEIAMPSETPIVPVPLPAEDNYAVIEGQRWKMEKIVPPLPVDCVPSDWSMESFTLSPTTCPPSGQQIREEKWVRTIITPAANGGAECGRLTEQRYSTQACTYAPPPPPPPPAGGKVTPIFDANGILPESWWAGLPKDTWLEVLGTRPDLLVPMLPSGFRDFGNGFNGCWSAWTGAAYDRATERMWWSGGGHHDSSNNGMGEFDFRTMKWRWSYKPTIITAEEMAHSKASWDELKPNGMWNTYMQGYDRPNYFWKNGEPTAMHTYHGIAWSPQFQRVLRFGLANVWHFDPVAGTYLKGIPCSWSSDNSSVYDEETGKWFLFHTGRNTYSNYQVFDAVANTVSPSTSIGRYTTYLNPALVGRKIFALCDHPEAMTAWTMDIATRAVAGVNLVNSPRIAGQKGRLFNGTCGYSPITKLFYAMQRPSDNGVWGHFTTVDPATGQCGEYVPGGTLPPRDTGNGAAPYTKFQIIDRPSGTFMLLFHLHNANLRIVRLS